MKLILLILLTMASIASGNESSRWRIDEDLKFNFTYYPGESAELPTERMLQVKGLLKNIASYKPDIDNIPYRGLLDLGFPIAKKDEAKNLRFLLKLYEFPSFVNHKDSLSKVLNSFYLHGVQGSNQITSFVDVKRNLAVKFAVVDQLGDVYTKDRPLKAFVLPDRKPSEIQAIFDSSIPFTSIYLKPRGKMKLADEKTKARDSSRGVDAFHLELLKSYRNKLVELSSGKDFFYFSQTKSCMRDPALICMVDIIQVPKQPMKFENYRDLPMPQNPSKIFLTSLLLLKTTSFFIENSEYKIINISKIKIEDLERNGRMNSSMVMEIGSVVRL